MLSILRAFAWMRWRVLVNSLERTGARDTLERFSLAIEQARPDHGAGPASSRRRWLLAALGGYAGYEAGHGRSPAASRSDIPVPAARGDRACHRRTDRHAARRAHRMPVRLLLLPIPRPTLYVAQAAGAVSDPWILLTLPIVAALPWASRRWRARSLAAVQRCSAASCSCWSFIGLSSLTTSLVYFVVRDRRRGELVGLFCSSSSCRSSACCRASWMRSIVA